MATTLRPTTISGTPVALALPDLGATGTAAPATAAAIAHYKAMVSRLGEADAAREAAEMDLRSARDEFLSASAVAFRFRAKPPDPDAVAYAEERVRDARQYREVVRRALDDAAAELRTAVGAERSAALDALDRQLTEVRGAEAEAIEHLVRHRTQRAELHAIRRWISDFPGTGGHVTQYRPAAPGKLPELRGADREPLEAAAVLDALRVDAAR